MQNAMFDNTVQLLGATLDYALRRHRVIAENLANVETPNYKAKDLPFSAILRASMERVKGQPTGVPRFIEPRIVLDVTGETRFDGNNVNAENEMIKLMKNSGLYTTSAELVKYKFNALRAAMGPTR